MTSNVELLVNNELERVWKEVVTKLRYAPDTFLEGLRETAIITLENNVVTFFYRRTEMRGGEINHT